MTLAHRLLAAGLLLLALVADYQLWASHQQTLGAAPYIEAIKAQKASADKVLAIETEKTKAIERALQAFRNQQEITDASEKAQVAKITRELRNATVSTHGRLRDPNTDTDCAGHPPRKDSVATLASAEDTAKTGGLFSAGATQLLTRLTAEADGINLAYASCRADAMNLRQNIATGTP